MQTVSQRIREIATWFDDDRWEEIKTLMDKQPPFRHGIAHFLRCYADDVERAYVALGGKPDMAKLWEELTK